MSLVRTYLQATSLKGVCQILIKNENSNISYNQDLELNLIYLVKIVVAYITKSLFKHDIITK